MPQIARVVIPGIPHHITQRGVRRMDIFYSEADRDTYLRLLREQSARFGLEHLVYTLMTNHVHLIAVPSKEHSLARALGEAHRRYTWMINRRFETKGYLFQGRFFSCPLDEAHLLAAARYVLMNANRARMVGLPWEYPWSSCAFHMGMCECDPLIKSRDLHGLVDDWREILYHDDEESDRLRAKTRSGRPCGTSAFIKKLEGLTGRVLFPRKRGRQPKRVKISGVLH